MSYNRFYIPTKEVAGIAKQLGYRRKKVSVVVTESVTLHTLNWDSGTRNIYHAVSLEGSNETRLASACQTHHMFNEHEGARVALRPGIAIAQTGTFMGNVSLMSLYVHPDNVPAHLEHYRKESV